MLSIYERFIRVIDYKHLGKIFEYNSKKKYHEIASKILHLETLIYDITDYDNDRIVNDAAIKITILPRANAVKKFIGLELDMDDNRIRYRDYDVDFIPKDKLNSIIKHRKSSTHKKDFADTNSANKYTYRVSFFTPYKLFTTLDNVDEYINKDMEFIIKNNFSDNFILVIIDLPNYLMDKIIFSLEVDMLLTTSRQEEFLPLWIYKILDNDDVDNNFVRELIWYIKKSIPVFDKYYSYNIIRDIFFNYFKREWKPKGLTNRFEEIFKVKLEYLLNPQWKRAILVINKDKIPVMKHNINNHYRSDLDAIFNILNDKLDKYR